MRGGGRYSVKEARSRMHANDKIQLEQILSFLRKKRKMDDGMIARLPPSESQVPMVKLPVRQVALAAPLVPEHPSPTSAILPPCMTQQHHPLLCFALPHYHTFCS